MGVVDTANGYVGQVQYQFGANNIDGGKGDCSSFTQTVFDKNGISIGRDTESQWTGAGTKVEGNLQAGDLVFFKDTYNSNHTDGVSHVGVYVGNGQFTHLGSSGVTTSSLSGFWQDHYLGAKRVSNANGSEGVGGVASGSVGGGSVVGAVGGTSGNSYGLKWWGDVVKVVIIALLLIGGVAILAIGVKTS